MASPQLQRRRPSRPSRRHCAAPRHPTRRPSGHRRGEQPWRVCRLAGSSEQLQGACCGPLLVLSPQPRSGAGPLHSVRCLLCGLQVAIRRGTVRTTRCAAQDGSPTLSGKDTLNLRALVRLIPSASPTVMIVSVSLAKQGIQARVRGCTNELRMDSRSMSRRRHVRRRARSARRATRTGTTLWGRLRSRSTRRPSRTPRLARPQCRSRSRRKLAQRQRSFSLRLLILTSKHVTCMHSMPHASLVFMSDGCQHRR